MNQNYTFRWGLLDGLPICLGYLSVSFAFGIFSTQSGLAIWETLLISMTNLTSAGQLAGVPIIAGGGTFIEMAVAQFVINLRYALMSISLSQKADESMTLPHRLLIAFGNTDEVFAVASSKKKPVGSRYMYGLILLPYLGWASGTLLGAVAGSLLPDVVVAALGIAIYGMFIAIVVPVAKENRPTALCVGVAVILSLLFHFLPLLSSIPEGFAVILSAVAAAALLAAFAPLDAEGCPAFRRKENK